MPSTVKCLIISNTGCSMLQFKCFLLYLTVCVCVCVYIVHQITQKLLFILAGECTVKSMSEHTQVAQTLVQQVRLLSLI